MKTNHNNALKNDYVTGLITGRTVKIKDYEGRISEEFVPNRANPYPSLLSIMRDTEELRHTILERESLVAPLRFGVVKEAKTAKEIKDLKQAKKDYKKSLNSESFQKERSQIIQSLKSIPNWGTGSRVRVV